MMDAVKRLVCSGFAALMLGLAGCATMGSSTLTLEPSAKINIGANVICRTEAAVFEFGHLVAHTGPIQAVQLINEKHGPDTCLPSFVGYIVVASASPPKTFEFKGVQYVVQRIVIFSERWPDGSVNFFDEIVEGYHAVQVKKPDDTGKKDPV